MKLTAEGNADVKTLLIVCYDFPWVWKKFYTELLIEWVSTLKIRWYIIVFLTEDFKNINNQKKITPILTLMLKRMHIKLTQNVYLAIQGSFA